MEESSERDVVREVGSTSSSWAKVRQSSSIDCTYNSEFLFRGGLKTGFSYHERVNGSQLEDTEVLRTAEKKKSHYGTV